MFLKSSVSLKQEIKCSRIIDFIRILYTGQIRLRKLQRRFSKAQKNSKRRERLRIKAAKQYRRISNRRSDFLHKLTTCLIRKYDTICLENLNVHGMMQNHHLANAISSVAWNEFVRQLAYKAEWNGKECDIHWQI